MALLQHADNTLAGRLLGVHHGVGNMRRAVIRRGDETDLVALAQGALGEASDRADSGNPGGFVAQTTALVDLEQRLEGRVVVGKVRSTPRGDRVRDAYGVLPPPSLPQTQLVGLLREVHAFPLAREGGVDGCRAALQTSDGAVALEPPNQSLVSKQGQEMPACVEGIHELVGVPPVVAPFCARAMAPSAP